MNNSKFDGRTREQIAIVLGFNVTLAGIVTRYGKVYNGHVNNGYKEVTFVYKNKTYHCKVHRIQAYIKYGVLIYEKGMMVRHLNNNKLDNSWINIAIGTAYDNAHDIPIEKRREMIAKASITRIKNKNKNKNKNKHFNFKFTFIIEPIENL